MSIILKEMKRELPGILNWAIEGYENYKKNGLIIPDIVKQETNNYKAESDVLSAFFEDMCTIGPSLNCPAKELYETYLKWCDGEKETPAFKSSRKMIEALLEKGFTKYNGSGNAVNIKGIGIRIKK